MRLSRDKLTLSLIDDVFESISKYFPIDDLDKFSFLKNIEDATDVVVRNIIRQYTQERFYKRDHKLY